MKVREISTGNIYTLLRYEPREGWYTVKETGKRVPGFMLLQWFVVIEEPQP
jgi:hypothetical protein